jgi:hypothetical protein
MKKSRYKRNGLARQAGAKDGEIGKSVQKKMLPELEIPGGFYRCRV